MCCTFTFTREKFSFIESRKNQIVHVKNFYDTLLQTVQNEPQIFSSAISSTVVTYEYFKRDFFLIAIFLIIQAKTPAIKTILKITITAIRDCQENPRVFIFGFSNKANQLFYLPFSTMLNFPMQARPELQHPQSLKPNCHGNVTMKMMLKAAQ